MGLRGRGSLAAPPWLVAVLAAAIASAAVAHTLGPDEVIARVTAEKTRGVESAARDEKVPRLLVVRVGAEWARLAPKARCELAESWHDLWRHAVPQGIVAILDATTNRPVVNFDTEGRARLVER